MTLSHERPDKLSRKVIGAAIEVHRHLGPGLLESTYEECLCWELSDSGVPFHRQMLLPIVYKGRKLADSYRPDIIVDNSIILEIKCVEKLIGVHRAQLATYLKHSGIRVGLLLNFNTAALPDGIKRVVL